MADTNWTQLPLDSKLYSNLDPIHLTRAFAAVENGYINEGGGHSRFPGHRRFATFNSTGRVYMTDFHGDLIAATGLGRLFKVMKTGDFEAVPGVLVPGGKRVIFDEVEDRLNIVAGGQIIQYDGAKTTLLSPDAPQKVSHIGSIDGYVLAIEEGRLYNSDPTDPSSWDPLDVFGADSKPDHINAMLVTPYREIMLLGEKSTEQWQRTPNGNAPFYRQQAFSEGNPYAYAVTFVDNALMMVNRQKEIVRVSANSSKPFSEDIQKQLQAIDDWTDAWMGGFPDEPLSINGQVFMLLQAPYASNPYGSKGLTFLFDIKNKKFSNLYGWDTETQQPNRWPGWSYWPMWDKIYVGGEGCIYEMTPDSYYHESTLTRWMIRTGHISNNGATIENLRLSILRGIGTYESEPTIRVRCRRDNNGWSRWKSRGLGRKGKGNMTLDFGNFGTAYNHQFEIQVTDNCAVEIRDAMAQVSDAGQ